MAKIGTVAAPGVLGRPGARKIKESLPETKLRVRDLVDVKNKPLLFWGVLSLVLFALNMVLPITIALKPEYRFISMINGALFSLVTLMVLRARLVIIAPVFVLLAMQAWATLSYMYGFSVTARTDDWGKQLFFAYEVVMPYFVVYALCQLNSNWRPAVLSMLLWLLTLSAVVGVLQFVHFPGFDSVYQYYSSMLSYDLGGETYKGVRAVGLTSHPLLLGMQAMTALAIIGSRFISRGLRWYEFVHAAVLCLALVMTQGRTLYAAGAIVTLIVLFTLARRNWGQALFTATAIFAIFLVAAVAFPGPFRYAFSSVGSGGRDSFTVRREIWEHYAAIFSDYWITGIGPDAAVFGSGSGLPGRWSLQLMENGYLAFYAMLGLPGLVLFVGGLVASFVGCIRILASRFASLDYKRAAYVGLAFTILLSIFAATSNTFDSNTIPHMGFIIAGVVAAYATEPARRRIGPRNEAGASGVPAAAIPDLR